MSVVEFKNEDGDVVVTADYEEGWEYASYSEARAAVVTLQLAVATELYGVDVTQEPAKTLFEEQTDRLIRGLQMPDDRLPDEFE